MVFFCSLSMQPKTGRKRLVHFGAFWCILVRFGAFWCVLVRFGAFWCILVHFAAQTVLH
jgi:hypothetical protein